jgi:hypothetical protein
MPGHLSSYISLESVITAGVMDNCGLHSTSHLSSFAATWSYVLWTLEICFQQEVWSVLEKTCAWTQYAVQTGWIYQQSLYEGRYTENEISGFIAAGVRPLNPEMFTEIQFETNNETKWQLYNEFCNITNQYTKCAVHQNHNLVLPEL